MVGFKARLALYVCILTIFSQAKVFAAGNVTLAWDASPDSTTTGYRVYYGGASGVYTNSATVGNVTNATFSNLADGTTFYFAAVAYNVDGFESEFSNETSYSVPAVGTTNQWPTLNAINNVTINEDAVAQTVNLAGISDGSATETQTVTVTASSSNAGLIPNPTVSYTSPNTAGTLSFTPVANASGSATITVVVNDNQPSNNIVTQTFTVTVNPVNDAPTITSIGNLTIAEDAATQTVNLSGIGTGASNETDALTVIASSSNTGLIPNPTVSYTSPNAAGSLTFTPVAGANGSSTITVTVNDGQSVNNISTRTFTVTVIPVNNQPTLNAISNVTINEDATAQTVSLSGIGTGNVNESQTLSVTASSSNTGLIPNPTVSYTSPNSTGSLLFTPVANANGSVVITVTANDNQSSNNIVTQTFTVTVNPVNDAPTLNPLTTLNILENATAQSVSLTGIGTGNANEIQTLSVTASSSDPSVVPNPSVSYTSPNTTGSLSFTPVANANGSAVITVTVNDGQAANNTVTQTFTVTVSAVNSPPTLDTLNNLTISEDASAQTVNLSGISTGATNENDTLVVTATSSNTGLIANPTVIYTSPNATGSLSFTPVANANGSAVITVTVNDGTLNNNLVTRTFTVTVNAVNDQPTLNSLSNISIAEDSGTQTVSLSGIGTGAANESQALSITASSSNTGLIPNPTVTYTSPNATGSLSFTPAANVSGSATITVTVNDNQSSNNIVTKTLTITVNSVNDAPTLNSISNVTLQENAAAQTVNLSGITSGAANESDTLVVTASSSNIGLIPNPTVSYNNPNSAGSLNFTPVTDANGTATVTVTVNDGQSTNSTFSRTFTVSVNAVNNQPTLAAISNLSVNEDSGAQSVSLTGIGTGAVNESQTLTVTASSSNIGLIPNPTVNYTSPNSTGSLNFTPVANSNGTATVTVTVNDGQTTNNTVTQTFSITVNAVNDEPTLAAISGRTISENSGVQIVNLTGIGTGVANESQPLTVTASSSDTSLIPNPSVTYTSPNATGSLSFTPVANANGTATITVTVNDNQGANNTITRTFGVTVTSVNSAPTISALTDITIVSDTNSVPRAFTIGDVETAASLLSLTTISTSPSVLPLTNIVFGGSSSNRTVTITPTPGSSGFSDVTITVGDGAASASTTFRVTATAPPPVTSQLSLNKSGNGTVTPDLNSTTLTVGQSYTVTAAPASGYIFTGWSGGVNSSAATITFVMTSNLLLTANFVPNPYMAAAGNYNGLFNQSDEVRLVSAGFFNIYADNSGNYSGWIQLAEGRYAFSGAFNSTLRSTNIVTRSMGNPLTIELHIGQNAESGQISGRVTDGVWSSLLAGGRAATATSLAGDYTVVIPGNVNDSSLPAGDGYATLHIAADGLGTMNGILGDGARFSQSAYVTADGDWPLFASAYTGKGAIMSWVSFTNLATSDLNGTVVWIKQAGVSATSFPLGFTNGTKAIGAIYTSPDAIGKAINLSGAVVTYAGGSLPANFSNVISVNSGSQVVNLSPNEMVMTIMTSVGSFTGQVREPGSGALHMYGGVILQKQTAGFGTMTGVPAGSRVVFAAP